MGRLARAGILAGAIASSSAPVVAFEIRSEAVGAGEPSLEATTTDTAPDKPEAREATGTDPARAESPPNDVHEPLDPSMLVPLEDLLPDPTLPLWHGVTQDDVPAYKRPIVFHLELEEPDLSNEPLAVGPDTADYHSWSRQPHRWQPHPLQWQAWQWQTHPMQWHELQWESQHARHRQQVELLRELDARAKRARNQE
jgi:hypothetical protein